MLLAMGSHYSRLPVGNCLCLYFLHLLHLISVRIQECFIYLIAINCCSFVLKIVAFRLALIILVFLDN